jgi:hypothetical protein
MTDFRKVAAERWQDSANVVLGAWLVLSPWILQFAALDQALWNAVIVGLIVGAAALAALVRFHRWEEWVDIALGAWLVVSPWVLGFAALAAAEGTAAGAVAATWNFVLVGLMIMVLAGWSLRDAQHRTTRTS